VARDVGPRRLLRRQVWPVAGLASGLLLVTVATVTIVGLPGSTSPSGGDATTTPGSATGAAGTGATSAAASATVAPTPSKTATPKPPSVAAPARFTTLRPGAKLPSGAQCAAWVRTRSYPESKGANRNANQKTGHHLNANFFSGDDPKANSVIAPRVDGQFTGTTRQILRWAACKWGIDEDLVLAQAAVESWWQQGTLGDWTADGARCAPGRGLGADGKPGQCPESFGILQNRYPYEQSAWPGIANSTAMNADVAYAIWRTCFEGHEGWLNTVERGRQYSAGDAWGCIGRWFSGRWHTPAGEEYVGRVRGYLDQRIWETPNFQQP